MTTGDAIVTLFAGFVRLFLFCIVVYFVITGHTWWAIVFALISLTVPIDSRKFEAWAR